MENADQRSRYLPRRGAPLWIRKSAVTGARTPRCPQPIERLFWVPSGSVEDAAALPRAQCWAFGRASSVKVGQVGALSVAAYLHAHVKYETRTENKKAMFDRST